MMLPRQGKNAIKIDIDKEDDAEDIELKKEKARENYGVKEETKPRERSVEPSQFRFDESKKRKQSFGTIKNESKTNQVPENKKSKPQINMNPTNKVIQGGTKTIHIDKKQQNIHKKTTIPQPEQPRSMYGMNKDSEMDIEEDSSSFVPVHQQKYNNYLTNNSYVPVKTEKTYQPQSYQTPKQ